MYQIVKRPSIRAKDMPWIIEERLAIYNTKEDAEKEASQMKSSTFWDIIIIYLRGTP